MLGLPENLFLSSDSYRSEGSTIAPSGLILLCSFIRWVGTHRCYIIALSGLLLPGTQMVLIRYVWQGVSHLAIPQASIADSSTNIRLTGLFPSQVQDVLSYQVLSWSDQIIRKKNGYHDIKSWKDAGVLAMGKAHRNKCMKVWSPAQTGPYRARGDVLMKTGVCFLC